MSDVPWPHPDEMQQLERAISDLEVDSAHLWFNTSGSWLNLDVWVHLEGERKFALWRATGMVYPVDNDTGAAGDDPIVPAIWRDCPYCDHKVCTTKAEIDHMMTKHPTIVEARLKFM